MSEIMHYSLLLNQLRKGCVSVLVITILRYGRSSLGMWNQLMFIAFKSISIPLRFKTVWCIQKQSKLVQKMQLDILYWIYFSDTHTVVDGRKKSKRCTFIILIQSLRNWNCHFFLAKPCSSMCKFATAYVIVGHITDWNMQDTEHWHYDWLIIT